MAAMTSAQRLRATYEFKPVDHLFRREFYIWDTAIERWKTEGMPADADLAQLFGYDPWQWPGASPMRLGWTEPLFIPPIEEKLLERSDEYEIIRDGAGRTVKLFRGKRHGFMPTYLKHAVTCEKDWERDILPRLDTPQRFDEKFWKDLADIKAAQQKGEWVVQTSIGGYMYLRALMGPTEVCLLFLDNPGLVHKAMQCWLKMADDLTARAQSFGIEYDEVFFGEDICYNHGLLISPDMVREFLFPYYQQLLTNMRSRQKRRIHFQLDTDGNCDEAIDLYRSIGMDVMSPFEVAAGNDVLAIAKKYPDLVMTGGIDKRVLAEGKEAIDDYLTRVIPFMVKRGGYIPTCDHGVPDDVSYENYLHYRKRIMELDH